MKDYSKPTPIPAALAAFPARLGDLMPPYDTVPSEFKSSSNKWVNWQQEWFFRGLDAFPEAKPGIDVNVAGNHLAAIQGSFEPKHEHKQAAVAYLASLWLVAPTGIKAR